ncbi:MAG TPA: ATP-dependent zinc metalloprotease FtsH, partial [Streptosporangiaceae bacterium]|nr:ATP-dependent zinc metalloprotease FtsH [Streptosporangiaceae bacterium]
KTFITQIPTALDSSQLEQRLQSNNVQIKATQAGGSWLTVLVGFLPLLLIVAFFWWTGRAAQRSLGGIGGFGRSRAKIIEAERPATRFADVAGYEGVKQEVSEVVDFLRAPQRYAAAGAKGPRGVIMVGPPGTGKTLIARAVAGEAEVPFLSVTGSAFVEMFVGVGASRVRDLFDEARKRAPSIVFIDEIDAIGGLRGGPVPGGHEEREQTLNQLLAEMDGFDQSTGIVVLAATNRPDILDPALLRPGRFDRQVVIDRPDLEGRKGILRVHARGKPFTPDVDLDTIARRTPGFTGADLANVINEAALLTARFDRKQIDMATMEESIDRVMAGPERKTRVMSESEKKIIAYHEGGHALVAHALPNADPVHKVTILPRGRALGYTMTLPMEDKFLTTRSEMTDQLAMLLGGRTAEELVFHEPTTGAANDIEKATSIARNMVTEYGMSERLGARKFGTGAGEVFLGRDVGHERDYSEDIASAIDDEVRRLIEAAHDVAWEILVEYRDVLDELVLQLMDKETLSKDQVIEVFSPIEKRPLQKSYTGYGKRLPSDRPPVLTPKELALMGPKDVQDLAPGNGGQRAAEPAEEQGERES